MNIFKKAKPEQTKLEKEEERILDALANVEPDSGDYDELMTHLKDLNKLKQADKGERKAVSPDAIVAAVASLGGIVMILGFEKAHIVTSKAMSFVFKPKA